MPRFAWVSGLIFCLVAMARAEPAGGPGTAQPGSPRGISTIQVFDDSVFQLEPKTPPPTTRKSAAGVERYLGEEADYNSEQRERWLEACEPMRNVDSRAYRECYEGERRKSREFRRQNQAEVENRNSAPLRNVPVPGFDSEAARNPAFDAQVERQ